MTPEQQQKLKDAVDLVPGILKGGWLTVDQLNAVERLADAAESLLSGVPCKATPGYSSFIVHTAEDLSGWPLYEEVDAVIVRIPS